MGIPEQPATRSLPSIKMSLNNVTHAVFETDESPICLRKTAEFEELAGRQGFFLRISRNPNIDGPFFVNLTAPAIWRFRILSSAFVLLRPVSYFASAITLAMTLAPNL